MRNKSSKLINLDSNKVHEVAKTEYRRPIYDSDRKRLARLQKECESILNALSETPSDSILASRLNAIEISIAAITGESAIEY